MYEAPLSNFPNGFANGVTIRDIPIQQSQPGKVFWVSNSTAYSPIAGTGGSNVNDGTYQYPFSTLDYAIGMCVAGRGDIIMLMPGYTDTVSSATSIVADVAGIAIVGLGSGTARPTITFNTATSAAIPVSGANIVFKNIIFTANFADIVTVFSPTAKNMYAEDCDFVATATDMNFTQIVDTGTTDNQVNGLAFNRCKWIEPDLATKSWIQADQTIDSVSITNCYANLGVNVSNLPVFANVANGKSLTNLRIDNNEVIRLNTANPLLVVFGNTTTTNTGEVSNNFVRHLDVAGELLVTTGSNIGYFNNFATAAIDASGALLPIADVTTSENTVPTADSTDNVLVRDVVGNKTDAAVTAVGTTKSILAYVKGLITMSTVQSADSTNNAFAGDVTGNKTDAAVTAVGTTKSILAYVKGLVTMSTVQAADATNNAFAGDVVGNKTDASVTAVGTTKSIIAYIKGLMNRGANFATKGAAVIVNGDTLFTVAGGPIQIEALWSECVTGNDATASTLQYNSTPTAGSAQTISGASASLASALAGASVSLVGTALTTAANLNANGANISTTSGGIIVPAGVITAVVAIGSTTGTWRHYIRYRPLATGVTVS